MHPTFTHVPPSPHVVPAGLGLTKSRHIVFAPCFAASFAAASPPEPPPMTTTSYSCPWSPLHDVSVIAGAPNDGGARDRGAGRSTPVRIENARRNVGSARRARATRVVSEMTRLDARGDRDAVRGEARARVRDGRDEMDDWATTGHFLNFSRRRATNRPTILGGNRASRAMARKSGRLILRDPRRRAARR